MTILQVLEPAARLLELGAGWILSVILMGVIAALYRQLTKQNELTISRYEENIKLLAEEIRRLADR